MHFVIQRWARAFRDDCFHECINTNNGTEALNKALKYTYMPRKKHSMNLSSIVSLLIETFLPALRQKYLFSNFEQSNLNHKYKDYVPSYLQNRPREVILHCLDRKASSARFTDWTEHHYPCKHFFAIFHYHPTWDWNALPQAYLCTPRLSLDTQALNNYFDPHSAQLDALQNEYGTQDVGDIPKRKVS